MDSRLIRRSRYEYEDESRETSTIMDLLGYGPVIRQIRRVAYKEKDRVWSTLLNGWMIITAGSKAEGLTCVLENDMDMMIVPRDIICLEECIDQRTIPDHINLFNMNLQRTSAGYCRLLLGRQTPESPSIINALCDDGHGNSLLSSTLYIDFLEKCMCLLGFVNLARAGPSMPVSAGDSHHDMVPAICCHCPVILQTWANRTRQWPPPEVVEKVVTMGAFVAPIGYKGSAYNHVEWRICFNTAETELVHNLNDAQVKIYVILKMIVKDILTTQKKEITSYILKNIVLWLAENNPQALFHSESLFHWLHEGLDILRTAISTRQLPYYMIPDRNLMAERDIGDEQQRVFVTSISCIMNEGPRILLRLNKLRPAIICHPEPLLWYSRMRTELEIVDLILTNRNIQYLFLSESDTMRHALGERRNWICQEVLWRMLQEGSTGFDLEQVWGRCLAKYDCTHIPNTANLKKLIVLF